jgi:hypothetical protein
VQDRIEKKWDPLVKKWQLHVSRVRLGITVEDTLNGLVFEVGFAGSIDQLRALVRRL